ncbi:MAG: ATP-binding cassette domain-containing protein [Actinobacteria bacterium]|nr:ATP-binding cassette domain-containing protein [Actinomycetota bacterium]
MGRGADQLVVENVHLHRGGREVLRGVSARFRSGIVTAVVGPSGSGKTSLLRCLNRLEEPRSGRVMLDGEDVRTIPPTALRQRVGMIFQTPQLFEGDVRANLAYGLPQLREETAGAALEAAGLPVAFLDRDSSALSVGQAQRVCIARALVRDPEALLMDEPTSALDKDAAARIEKTITELAAQGLTIVLVTHNLAQARQVARRGILLNDGTALAEGDLDTIEATWPGEESS